MRISGIVMLVVIIAALGLWLARRSIYNFVVTDHLAQELPALELKDLHGETIRLSDYRGKILVLDFWTTWCGACKQAFPDFQKVIGRFTGESEVAFLAVNTSHGGDTIDKARTFMRENGLTFHAAYDSGATLSDQLGIKYYPTVMVVDRSGVIRFKHIGYSKSLEDFPTLLEKHIRRLLGKREFSQSGEAIEWYFNITAILPEKTLHRFVGLETFPLGGVCSLNLDGEVGLRCQLLY